MKVSYPVLTLAIFILAGAVTLFAAIPETITYQGRLTDADGAPVAAGSYDITFTIVSTATGLEVDVWQSGPHTIGIVDGVINFQLGAEVALPDDIFATDTTLTLRVKVGTEDIFPRTKLSAAAYAYHALRADTSNYAAAGSVNNNAIINEAVSSAKIKDGTILFEDIGQNSAVVGQVPSWNGSSWEAVNADGDISSVIAGAGLAGGGDQGPVSLSVANESITSSMIKDGEVQASDIQANAVDSSKILDKSILFEDLAQNGASAGQVPSWTGTTWGPVNAAIGTITKITAGAGLSGGGGNGEVAISVPVGGITSAMIDDDAIQTEDIAADAIITSRIKNGTIQTADLSFDPATQLELNSHQGSASVHHTKTTSASQLTSGTLSDSRLSSSVVRENISNTFATTNTFNGNFKIGDSTFYANNSGIRIGDPTFPSASYLMYISRRHNATGARYGTYILNENSNTGTIYGLYSRAAAVTAGSGGSTYGVYGMANSDGGTRYGLYARATTTTTTGSASTSGSCYGVRAQADYGSTTYGLYAYSSTDGATRYGVYAYGTSRDFSLTTGNTYGVYSLAFNGATAYGIYAYGGSAETNWAGYFSGNIRVTGSVNPASVGFQIDHPLDPENMYLQHSSVESPDMMNVYNGNVSLDASGEAFVLLPDYFEEINRDFRYQLTAIGAPGPNLYIAETITNGTFAIAGGASFSEVSWQVTGIRKDKWAEAHRIEVEKVKSEADQGYYLHYKEWNQSVDRAIDREQLLENERVREEQEREDRAREDQALE